MKKTFFVALLLLIGFAATPQAYAQTAADALRYTQRGSFASPRSTGMAGVGLAGIADPGAIFTNPAGLGFMRSSQVGAGLNTVFVQNDGTYLLGNSSNERTTTFSTTRFDNAFAIQRVPTVQGSLVFGIGFQQNNAYDRELAFRADAFNSSISSSFLPGSNQYRVNNDGSISFDRTLSSIAYRAGLIEYYQDFANAGQYPFLEAVKPNTTVEQRGQILERGPKNDLALAGAVEVAPGVMAGASVNLGFGTYVFERRFEERDALNQNGVDDYFVVADGRVYEGFDRLIVRDRIRTGLVGLGLKGGISFQGQGPFRAGLTLETPTYYTVTEDYETRMEIFFDDGGTLAYGGRRGDVGTGTYEYGIITPWRLGAGFAFIDGPIHITTELEFLDWSQLRLDDKDNSGFFDDENALIRNRLGPVLNVRTGLEYTMNNLTLRMGAAYLPDARTQRSIFDDTFDEEDHAFRRSQLVLSAGLSLEAAQNTFIDFGLSQTSFKDRYIPYNDGLTSALVEERILRNRITLGVRIGF